MKKLLYGSLFMATMLSSCKKSGNDAPTALSLLTSKNWKPALTDLDAASSPAGNAVYSPVPDCALDDIYRFGANNKVTINGGTVKCSTGEASPAILDYLLDHDTKKLTIGQIQYVLLELSATQLKLAAVLPPAQGSQYLIRIYHH